MRRHAYFALVFLLAPCLLLASIPPSQWQQQIAVTNKTGSDMQALKVQWQTAPLLTGAIPGYTTAGTNPITVAKLSGQIINGETVPLESFSFAEFVSYAPVQSVTWVSPLGVETELKALRFGVASAATPGKYDVSLFNPTSDAIAFDAFVRNGSTMLYDVTGGAIGGGETLLLATLAPANRVEFSLGDGRGLELSDVWSSSQVPEPSTWVTLGSALALLGGARFARRTRRS